MSARLYTTSSPSIHRNQTGEDIGWPAGETVVSQITGSSRRRSAAAGTDRERPIGHREPPSDPAAGVGPATTAGGSMAAGVVP